MTLKEVKKNEQSMEIFSAADIKMIQYFSHFTERYWFMYKIVTILIKQGWWYNCVKPLWLKHVATFSVFTIFQKKMIYTVYIVFKEIVWYYGKYAYSFYCQELGEEIYTTLMSVCWIWSHSEQWLA